MSTPKALQHVQYGSPSFSPCSAHFHRASSADHAAGSAESSHSSPLQIWMTRKEDNFTTRLASQTAVTLDEDEISSGVSMPVCDFGLHISLGAHEDSEDDSISDLGSEYSDMVPSLTQASSSASSSSLSALGSDVVSVINGGHVLEMHGGVLTLDSHQSPDADLVCPFHILECQTILTSIVDFKHHVFGHFRGHPLPVYAPCFLCDTVKLCGLDENPSVPWNEMLSHMVHDHYRAGQQIGIFKPKIALMRYLWNRHIITEAQFKASQLVAVPMLLPEVVHLPRPEQLPRVPMAPSATPPVEVQAHLNNSVGFQNEAYVISASRRSERRQRDSTRLFSHVQGRL